METKQIRNDALEATLKCVDRPPEEWFTFNDGLHTRILRDGDEIMSPIKMNLEEYGVLECVLPDSFVLVTTKRVVSKVEGVTSQMDHINVTGFGNDFSRQNNEIIDNRRPKVNRFVLLGKDGTRLHYVIDSHYPAYFAQILISNLYCFIQKGEWFLNPSLKWKKGRGSN